MESCDLLQPNKYLGTKGIRTLFNIECKKGKSIRSHSYNKDENAILLLPATQFQVINQDKLTDDLYIIYLKEISPRYTLLQSPFDTDEYNTILMNALKSNLFVISLDLSSDQYLLVFLQQIHI
jgi:hypothetical protein